MSSSSDTPRLSGRRPSPRKARVETRDVHHAPHAKFKDAVGIANQVAQAFPKRAAETLDVVAFEIRSASTAGSSRTGRLESHMLLLRLGPKGRQWQRCGERT